MSDSEKTYLILAIWFLVILFPFSAFTAVAWIVVPFAVVAIMAWFEGKSVPPLTGGEG